MNILLLIDTLGPGGAETHAVTLARALQAAGHRVGVVSSGGCLEKQLTEQGVAVWHLPADVRSASFTASLARHVAFLRRLHRQCGFDVMHAHTRRTAVMLRAYRLCERVLPSRPRTDGDRTLAYRRRAARRVDRPALIVTVHARFSPRYRRLSYWGDATVAVSEDLKRHAVQAFSVPSERVTVVPNGIDEAAFYPPQTGDDRDQNEVSVVFASRLDGDCSVAAEALIEAVPALVRAARKRGKRLSVTVLGGGDRYAAVAAQAARINARCGQADGPVHAVGYTDRPAEYFRHADVFVGVSRAALEALFCGCTVILAGNEGYAGLVTEENFDALAEQNFCCRGRQILVGSALSEVLYRDIVRAVDTPSEQKRARAQALGARVRRDYGASRMGARTLQVYERVLTENRRLNVLIGGYAGCGNLGDDAILRCLIERWQGRPAPACLAASDGRTLSEGATLSVAALTGERMDKRLACVPRASVAAVLRAMRRADAFVLGGGALLQNCSPHGNRSLLYYLALLLAARLCGCPFSVVANGIGPLKGQLARTLTAAAVRGAVGISVRDGASRALLVDVGLSPDRIRIESDPVLSVVPDGNAAKRLLAEHELPDGFVCILPRPTDGHTLRMLATAVMRLWRERGVYPLLFALDGRRDTPVCRALIRELGVGTLLPCDREQTVAGVLAQSRGVISLRLHGLILAKAGGARALCVPYSGEDGKTVNFARSAGQAVANGANLTRLVLEMTGVDDPTSNKNGGKDT